MPPHIHLPSSLDQSAGTLICSKKLTFRKSIMEAAIVSYNIGGSYTVWPHTQSLTCF